MASELRSYGVEQDVIERLVLATAEACNNAIIHSRCTSFGVTIEVDDEACTVTVVDAGNGFDVPDHFEMPDPSALSRRGLALMRALVKDVIVQSTDEGTTVTLRHPVRENGARSTIILTPN